MVSLRAAAMQIVNLQRHERLYTTFVFLLHVRHDLDIHIMILNQFHFLMFWKICTNVW